MSHETDRKMHAVLAKGYPQRGTVDEQLAYAWAYNRRASLRSKEQLR